MTIKVYTFMSAKVKNQNQASSFVLNPKFAALCRGDVHAHASRKQDITILLAVIILSVISLIE